MSLRPGTDLPELHRALIAAADARTPGAVRSSLTRPRPPLARSARSRARLAPAIVFATALVLLVLAVSVSASGAGGGAGSGPSAADTGRTTGAGPTVDAGRTAAGSARRTATAAPPGPTGDGVALVECLLRVTRTTDALVAGGGFRALGC